MALDFLRSIERARLPMRVDDPEEIGCVHILRAAQLLEATVKESNVEGEEDFVLVERITWQGRAELARRRSHVQA